jgi:putative membrane protein
MTDFILTHYLWFKAIHLIAVISWMAGMLYLPRLYVYHVTAKKGGELSETLKIMERRLLRFIMNPAMIITWILGLTLIATNTSVMTSGGWMHAKLLLVVIMSGMHMALAVWRKQFERDVNTHSQKFFRIMNEVPTVLLVIIVILVIVKPF